MGFLVELFMTDRWLLNESIFGPLWSLIQDETISDIDWDGNSLWVSSVKDGTKKVDIPGIDEKFVSTFSHHVANSQGAEFNQIKNVLQAETPTLRITIVHESLATSGRCFSIRKSMPKLRFTAVDAVNNDWCGEDLMNFLVNCVTMHSNMAFCGEPGAGKTEGAKFFSTFIPGNEKVLTIEDTLEWHYKEINPGKRADEIKVNDADDYTKAIKVALRLNPSWLMLSEARSTEVQYLIEGWSTGVNGMTTIHAGDVRDIPDRITNMIDKGLDATRIANNVYSYLNIGILVKKDDTEGSTKRRIRQVGIFRHTEEKNECTIIMEDGKFYKDRIPEWFLEKMSKAGIINPFYSAELQQRMDNERRNVYYGNYDETQGANVSSIVKNTEKVIKNTDIDEDDIIDIIEGRAAV